MEYRVSKASTVSIITEFTRHQLSKTCVIVFLGWHFEIVSKVLILQDRLVYSMKYMKCSELRVVIQQQKKRELRFNDL